MFGCCISYNFSQSKLFNVIKTDSYYVENHEYLSKAAIETTFNIHEMLMLDVRQGDIPVSQEVQDAF